MISAEGINYQSGAKVILDDVSLTLPAGQVTAVLGPNGAGKTTLLKCLSGSLTPQSGLITLNGKGLMSYTQHFLSGKRAVLSQSNPISFPFTALEIVLMGRHPHLIGEESASDKAIARQALDSMDAWHLRDRLFPTLSGGEQQRVQLARVLTQIWEQDNACLFLDEPTSALDLKHQHNTLQLARKLSATMNMTICLIMHDLNLAFNYSDQIILLRDGKVFASGAPETICTPDNIQEVFEIPALYLARDLFSHHNDN